MITEETPLFAQVDMLYKTVTIEGDTRSFKDLQIKESTFEAVEKRFEVHGIPVIFEF